MRRMIFIFLVVVGVLALGVRFFVNERLASETPPGMEIQLVEYESFNQLNTSESPIAQLQDSIDAISEAALKGQWTVASRSVQQLEDMWRSLTPSSTGRLETERQVQMEIQTLYYNVWDQNEQAVLATAQKLTMLFNQLSR